MFRSSIFLAETYTFGRNRLFWPKNNFLAKILAFLGNACSGFGHSAKILFCMTTTLPAYRCTLGRRLSATWPPPACPGRAWTWPTSSARPRRSSTSPASTGSPRLGKSESVLVQWLSDTPSMVYKGHLYKGQSLRVYTHYVWYGTLWCGTISKF